MTTVTNSLPKELPVPGKAGNGNHAAMPGATPKARTGVDQHSVTQVCDLSEAFELLARENPDAVSYYRAAMRLLTKRLGWIGFGSKGRLNATSLTDFARRQDFGDAFVEPLKSQIHAVTGQLCGEQGTFLSGPVSIGNRKLSFLSVGVKDFQGRDFTVVTTVVCEASHPQDMAIKCSRYQAAILLALSFMPKPPVETKIVEAEDKSLSLVPRVTRFATLQEFAFALVNSLADKYRCQQIVFGVPHGQHCEVIAVSGTDTFKASSPGVIAIQQAMEEACDVRETVAYQAAPALVKYRALPVHIQWANASRSSVCTVVLKNDLRCVAVVSFRRDGSQGFSEIEIGELEKMLSGFTAAIELAIAGQRTLWKHFRDESIRFTRSAFLPKSNVGKYVRIGLLVAAACFALGWAPYRPTHPCIVVPANLTQSLAPFEMQLKEARVHSGDYVKKGDVLACFETRLFEIEKAKLISQRDQAEIDVRAALVEGNAAAASLHKASARVFQQQLNAVNKKIELCTIVAPDDGMVVSADLEERIGQVFAQGQPVLSFSPMDRFTLEIRIPEDLARHIEPEQFGSFVTASDPGNHLRYQIRSISGAAEVIDGKNVLVARADLDAGSDHLRQGMEGYARTSTGWRPIPWIVFHRAYDYLCTLFWF